MGALIIILAAGAMAVFAGFAFTVWLASKAHVSPGPAFFLAFLWPLTLPAVLAACFIVAVSKIAIEVSQ
jgi:hypothetical protein